ncbi:Alpha/Beta hydrolase protein [Coemansia spiralis]|nr:Alpha/Beta hydrolase protein [Coemansia spiralis]
METTETPTETIIATTLIQDEPEKVVSRQEDDVLAIFAAYSGAAYKVTNEWDCEYACQYPGTEGTIIEYNWNIGFPPSAGYIARNPNSKTIITAFQGTEDQSQWLDNLDVALKPWPEAINGSEVHTGFLHGYLDVRDDVVNELKTIASKYLDYSIALVGHSLGGARAALCLLDLSITTPELLPRMYLYTQGQPRTGNKEFANAIDALSVPKYREVYEYDIVPRIPPTFLGYAHHLTEVWIHNNETVLCVNPIDDNSCSGNGDLLHPLSILDHFRYPGLKYEISSN